MIESRGYDRRRLRLLASFTQGTTVLDVGYAQQPNPYLNHFHRVGLDLNLPSAECPVRYEEELVGDVGGVAELLRGREFDTIICAEIIEHIENPYALLRDLHPLLADGGRLLVSTPNPLAFPVVVAEFLRLKRYFYTSEHLYYFLPRWVTRILERAGYEVEDVRPVGLWTPFFGIPLVPVALSYQVIYVARKPPR